MSDLIQLLKRLAAQQPELSDTIHRTVSAIELIELREPNAFGPERLAARDPNEQAYNLLKDWKGLERELTSQVKDVAKALQAAERQVDNLESVGSHYLSAPSILAGDPLKRMESLSGFLDDVVSQLKELARHGR